MQLTKLVAAPELPDKVPARARAARSGAGTASQLIRSVRRTGVQTIRLFAAFKAHKHGKSDNLRTAEEQLFGAIDAA
jgi:hypothetical protein